MSESRVRENLMHGLMRGKRAKPSNLLYWNFEFRFSVGGGSMISDCPNVRYGKF